MASTIPHDARSLALTHDGRLRLVVDAAVADAVAPWVPHSLRVRGAPGAVAWDHAMPASDPAMLAAPLATLATIVVREADGAPAPPRPAGPPELTFLGVSLWRDGADAMAMLADRGGAAGRIDLGAGRATLTIGARDPATAESLYGMLTLAAAYLLGRAGRALVHAASLVAPDGRAWLLVGDTHAGKSTTCATLLDAGWGYCADDHTIVGPSPEGGLVVEGWPRVLHLDRGWAAGEPAGGDREDVDALARWPAAWRRSAPLAGVLFPRVEGASATAVEPLSPAQRFARLVRQSPWFLGDPAAAPRTMALLREVASLPGGSLRLGRDSFRRAATLAAALAPLTT